MPKIAVGDADALVALYFKEDNLHQKATAVLEELERLEVSVFFPNTAIAEAITVLRRKLSNSSAAELLAQDYNRDCFNIKYVDEKIMKLATEFFTPRGSKQNTFFDAIIASTAKSLKVDMILSFDKWYKKLGFKLTSSLV